MVAPWKERYDKYRQHITKQSHHFVTKICLCFSSSQVWMWSWTITAECWRIDAFEFWSGSPLDSKGIKPINPKGNNQPWIVIGRAEAEASVLCPLDMKSQLIGKGPEAGKDWRQKKKWMTGWDGWMASLTQWTSLSKHQETVKHREAWHAAVCGITAVWSRNAVSGHISRDKRGSKRMCAPVFLAAPLITVERWRQPKRPSTKELIW